MEAADVERTLAGKEGSDVTTEETTRHPYQVAGGQFPHELRTAHFHEWLVRNSVKEHHYWLVLGRDLDLTEMFGPPVLTAALTEDQRGWAKQRYRRALLHQGCQVVPPQGQRRTGAGNQADAPEAPQRRRRRHS